MTCNDRANTSSARQLGAKSPRHRTPRIDQGRWRGFPITIKHSDNTPTNKICPWSVTADLVRGRVVTVLYRSSVASHKAQRGSYYQTSGCCHGIYWPLWAGEKSWHTNIVTVCTVPNSNWLAGPCICACGVTDGKGWRVYVAMPSALRSTVAPGTVTVRNWPLPRKMFRAVRMSCAHMYIYVYIYIMYIYIYLYTHVYKYI